MESGDEEEVDEENVDEGDNNDDDGDEGGEGGDGFNDPFFNDAAVIPETKSTSKKKKKEKKGKKGDAAEAEGEEELTEEEKKKRKELELLILDEEEDKKHFHLKEILQREKDEKSKRKRKKMGKAAADKKKVEDDFELNVSDPRFGALYSSHLYSLDPSDPNFKRTKATQAIIEESQKRHKNTDTTGSVNKTTASSEAPVAKKGKLDPKLSEMINSVKSKTALHTFKKEKNRKKGGK